MDDKKLIFSAIQPTGTFTLGNYIGAVRNWGPLQEQYNCIYCVADLHAITVKQEPAKLRQNTLAAYALLMACGLDPRGLSSSSRATLTPTMTSTGCSAATRSSASSHA